ncbi:MAG TPA: FoF1 ATP synthase subunit gamma, partial [Candidatus Saccharimonadales bacterium]|nr:FoF1 ATP synthase subunit gamma [Candidatus Saccharimonadales bacterium]
FPFGNTLPSFDAVFPLSQFIDEYFVSGKVAKVQVLSTNFQSIFTQTPMLTTVLPVEIATDTRSHFSLFEPGEQELLPQMLKHYLEMTLYRHLLESYLSEQAARMLSMQNATNNANDMIEDLKLEYNKLRQERITSEILDISSAKTVS